MSLLEIAAGVWVIVNRKYVSGFSQDSRSHVQTKIFLKRYESIV